MCVLLGLVFIVEVPSFVVETSLVLLPALEGCEDEDAVIGKSNSPPLSEG